MTTDLSRRETIGELVAVYNRACADIRSGFALVACAVDSMNAAFAKDDWGTFYAGDSRYHRYPDFHAVDEVLVHLRRQTWRFLVERLELSRFLSVARAKELDAQLERGELPEITVESVEAFANGYLAALPDMLTEAVQEVFEWLRPRGGRAAELKTNSQFEVPRKVIVWAVERGYGDQHFRINYHCEPQVTALENVFTALDGRGQITKTYRSELSNAVKETGPDGRGETRYFKFRACKNQHLHIEFKRLDLLKRFNAIAGGKRLRGAVTTTDS